MSYSSGTNTYTFHGPRAYMNTSLWKAPMNSNSRGQRGASAAAPDRTMTLSSPGRRGSRPLLAACINTGEGYLASATMGTSDLLREPMAVGAGTNPSDRNCGPRRCGSDRGHRADLANTVHYCRTQTMRRTLRLGRPGSTAFRCPTARANFNRSGSRQKESSNLRGWPLEVIGFWPLQRSSRFFPTAIPRR